MSPYDVCTCPLLITYSLSDKGRVWTILSFYAQYGDGGTLRLRWHTLSRNLRFRSRTPEKLTQFLSMMEGDLLLTEFVIEGDYVTLEATHHLYPYAYRRDASELELSEPDVDAGRAPSERREAVNERKARSRTKMADKEKALETCLEQIFPNENAVTLLQNSVTSPVTVTAKGEIVTDLSQPHVRSDHDPDHDLIRSDLFIKESDPDQIRSKGSGETQSVTPPVTSVPDTSVWERDLMALIVDDPEKWTSVEVAEAMRRMKEQIQHKAQLGKPPIKSKLTYLRTILGQVRGEGFDQQRTRMLHGAVTGGKGREPVMVETQEPCQDKPGDNPAIQAFKAKRTGTEA